MAGPDAPLGTLQLSPIAPDAAQLLDVRAFQLREVVRVFALPAALVTNGRKHHGRT